MTADIAVGLRLPSDFHALTIGIGPDDARAELLARLDDPAADVPGTALAALADEYARASQWLGRAGVCYAATCLGLLEGELTLATLTLTRVPLDCRDLDTALDGLVEVLGDADPDGRQARRYELPCGPAVVAVGSAVEAVLPAAAAGTEQDVPVVTASLEAWVPVPAAADPTRQSAVVVRFGTPRVRHWEAYCPVLVEALRTLHFPATADREVTPTPQAPAAAVSRIAQALG